MEAVILAGGKGTRLYPYTIDLPKALVPIGNTPIIELLLRQLKKNGVSKAHIAVNHLAHRVKEKLGDGRSLGIQIDYTEEDTPLGTVGPITLIKDLPDHFIVANGDVISDLDIKMLFDFHKSSNAMLTVATHVRNERIDFGVLESASDGHVTGFTEKPGYRFAVSMGINVFSKELLRYVPGNQPFGFDQLMLTLLSEKVRIMAYPYEGFWLDIGRPDDYERALREWPSIEKLLA
jgi:NDP-mannose synthase